MGVLITKRINYEARESCTFEYTDAERETKKGDRHEVLLVGAIFCAAVYENIA